MANSHAVLAPVASTNYAADGSHYIDHPSLYPTTRTFSDTKSIRSASFIEYYRILQFHFLTFISIIADIKCFTLNQIENGQKEEAAARKR